MPSHPVEPLSLLVVLKDTSVSSDYPACLFLPVLSTPPAKRALAHAVRLAARSRLDQKPPRPLDNLA